MGNVSPLYKTVFSRLTTSPFQPYESYFMNQHTLASTELTGV